MSCSATEKLKLTEWYGPALKNWDMRRVICEKLGSPVEQFETIATEILNALEHGKVETVREMLAIQEVQPYELHVSYKQYTTPILPEQIVGLSTRTQSRKR